MSYSRERSRRIFKEVKRMGKKSKGWSIVKAVGITATIAGGVLTAICDIPKLKDTIKDIKNSNKNEEGE